MNLYRRNVHLWGPLVVAVIVGAISATALRRLNEYDDATAEAEQARRTLAGTAALLSDLKDAETGERGFLLTGDESYLEPYDSALPRIRTDLDELTGSTRHSADPAGVSALRPMVASMLAVLARTIDGRRKGQAANATEYAAGKQSMDAVRLLCDRLTKAEQERVNARAAAMHSRRDAVQLLILGGTALIAALLCVAGVFTHRLIRSRDVLIQDYGIARDEARQERDRLETTLRSIGDAVIVTDTLGRITLINPVAARLTGWSRPEAEGTHIKSVFDIVNELTGAQAANPVGRVLREGMVVGLANHTVLRNRSGQEVPIDDSGAPIRDHTGALTGAVLVFRDVTDRYRSQKQLEESERRYRLMFENNPQPMWVFDIETFEFLAVNDAAVQHYGYSSDEFAQMTLRDLRPEEDVPAMIADATQSRGLHRDGPWRHRKKDGTLIMVDITAHPLQFNGRAARVVLASDVTDRVNALQALRETSDRLSTMVDTAPLAIWTLDRQGRVTSWNRMAAEMFQWSTDEVLGKQIEIIPEEKKAEFAALLLRYKSGERVTAFETVRRRRDGSLIPVTLWSAPLADHANRKIATLMIATDISQKKRDEQILAQTEAGFRLLFENNPQPMWVINLETLRFLEVNNAAIAHYGYSREEFLAMCATDIRTAEEAEKFERAIRSSATQVAKHEGTWKHLLKSGKPIEVDVVSHQLDFNGRRAILAVLNDVTERRTLEEQLRQSQKLEAVGRLAGGVAHDFNNLLTVIIGYSDLLRVNAAGNSTERIAVDEVSKAAERASSLTRQLLAFSRKQVLQPQSLNLNQSVLRIQQMLSRLIGENVEIVTDLGDELWSVSADPGQIDQIIMNLSVNARDAMEEGGILTIQTQNVFLGEDYLAHHPGVATGEYVLLSVTDTGCGMDAETLTHIFEPFYTTKVHGRGTGLGLATVYGIVKQSGGDIWVYSEPGLGTCMKVYFPRLAEEAALADAAPPHAAEHGNESILLVEDEGSLRQLIAHLLEVGGYMVVAVATAEEALTLIQDPASRFDVLLTDIVLPRGNGWDLAARVAEFKPQMRTLLMSGYSEAAVLKRRPFEANLNFIQKPFNGDALRSKIRAILDYPRSMPAR